MLAKIYLIVLAASVAATGILLWYAWTWLGSIGSPADAAAGYQYNSSIALTCIWFSSAVLLALAIVTAWTRRNAWALWATFAYFALAICVFYFGAEGSYVDFLRANGMPAPTIAFRPYLGFILAAAAGAAIYAIQFAIVRLHARMFPELTDASIAEDPTETIVEPSPGGLGSDKAKPAEE